MQNILKEKKYFLIVVVFSALGALLLFINPINKEIKVTEDGATKEEISITSNETGIKKDEISSGLDSSDSKQDKFNQAIIDGDKSFLNKDYQQSIIQYNKSLSYVNSQIAYMRLFNTYNIIGDINKAIEAIDKAIVLKPQFVDYRNTKIQYLDDKTNTSFVDLKATYQDGLTKVDGATKINLVTFFARIAENNGQKAEAISTWEYAIQLYPQNKLIYQAEIDRLRK